MVEELFDELVVVKRSGQRVNFNGTKIAVAIKSAFDEVELEYTENDVNKVYSDVLEHISSTYSDRKTINVEDVQDIIEEKLKSNNYDIVYEAFNSYRLQRAVSREVFSVKQQHKFVKAVEKIGLQTNKEFYSTPLETMLGFGKTVSREFSKAYLLDNKYVRAHDEGIIYIHNLDFYPVSSLSMIHLNLDTIRDNCIKEYLNKLLNIISNCKREHTGEQSINSLNKILSKIIINNFKIIYKKNLYNYLNLDGFLDYIRFDKVEKIIDELKAVNFDIKIFNDYILNNNVNRIFKYAYIDSLKQIEEDIYISIKNFLSNLNEFDYYMNNNKTTISIVFDQEYESTMIADIYIKVILELNVLNNVNTILKFDSLDYISNDIINCISNNKNISISFNTNAEYFSDGEKIYNNVNDEELTSKGRCVLSTTSINLGRIGISNRSKSIEEFYAQLGNVLDFTKNQLIQRFDLQASKYKNSFPNLFKNNLIMDSEKVEDSQKIRKILRNGVLNISLVGLNECLSFLPQDDKPKLKIDILNFINNKINQYSDDVRLNFILSETKDDYILKELLAIDKSIYGTDYYNKDKKKYSLISTVCEENIKESYNDIQKYINTRIDIVLRKNSSEKKILETINKAKALGILFFKIKLGKDDN